jgi:transcriptional regulator of acetoin/glycerol metabolism
MSRVLRTIRKPSGIIFPLDQVKRRAIVEALDECDSNYFLATQLLGIWRTTIYRRAYNYQTPTIRGKEHMESGHES